MPILLSVKWHYSHHNQIIHGWVIPMNRQMGLKPKVTKFASILSWYFLLIILISVVWMGEWINDWRDSSVSKMMAILSLLLCDPSACWGELLSPGSSDCNLVGVILEMKKHAKWLTSYFLHIGIEQMINGGVKKVSKLFWGVYVAFSWLKSWQPTQIKYCK